MYLLLRSYALTSTCLDDHMLLRSHLLKFTYFYVRILCWSYTSMFTCFDNHMLQCQHASKRTCSLSYLGNSGILPLILKKNWQYAPVCKLYKSVPLFWYSIILKSSSIKYSICRKSSYARSNLKKNKNKKNFHGTRVSGNRVPCKKKFYKCNCPYSGSPIVPFLSPIVTL